MDENVRNVNEDTLDRDNKLYDSLIAEGAIKSIRAIIRTTIDALEAGRALPDKPFYTPEEVCRIYDSSIAGIGAIAKTYLESRKIANDKGVEIISEG